MTKKSLNRIQRDLSASNAKKELEDVRKNTNTWDDLNAVHFKTVTMLYGIPDQIAKLFSVEKIENFLADRAMTKTLIDCLNSDLQTMNEELKQIHNSHKDKTGSCKNDEEFISSLTIVEAYNSFRVKFEGVILPTVSTLGQHFDEAVAKANQILEEEKNKAKDESLTDPNIISEAIVKDTQ